MPSYETRKVEVRVGDHKFRLKALLDHQQYSDPDGRAERAGISSATWPLFGQFWPASRALAEAVQVVEIEGRRILEIGCGLGLPSLVLQQRGADITASDHHPMVEHFLDYNAALNKLEPLNYFDLSWEEPAPELGHFDLIIGSDVLYERNHAELVAQLIKRHAHPRAEVMITCPGRGYRGRLSRALQAQGFRLTEKPRPFEEGETPPFRGRLLRFKRTGTMQAIGRPCQTLPTSA